MWTICRELHVLPSSPDFQRLNTIQISWILENIILDKKEQAELMKGRKGVSSSTVSVDDDEFEKLVKSKKHKQG